MRTAKQSQLSTFDRSIKKKNSRRDHKLGLPVTQRDIIRNFPIFSLVQFFYWLIDTGGGESSFTSYIYIYIYIHIYFLPLESRKRSFDATCFVFFSFLFLSFSFFFPVCCCCNKCARCNIFHAIVCKFEESASRVHTAGESKEREINSFL